MQYQSDISPISSNREELERSIEFTSARIIELGCGNAATIIELATSHPDCEFVATEVDRVQHEKNLSATCPPNLCFRLGGAQQIDLPNASIDAVIMLKSLHHVPSDLLSQSFEEVHRVLKPGGLWYISEPVYAGDFNSILKMFHDERVVRLAAFEAISQSVADGQFELVEQTFFDAVRRFEGFDEYERIILGQTHTQFNVDEQLLAKVKMAFERIENCDGITEFRCPQRVDLLRRIP